MAELIEQAPADSTPRAAEMFVGGEWVSALGGERLDVLDPGTGALFATVPDAGAQDVRRAVEHARGAFDGGAWSLLEARDRSRLLFRMADLLRRDRDRIAELEVRDNGKPLAAAQWDVDESAFLFEYYAGWVTKLAGEMPPVGSGAMSLVESLPVGVAALITPWNFPLLMAAQKAAPALAAGCAVVLKPAEQTPLTALELARIASEVELPAGAFNVVTGRGETAGAALVDDPGVDKVSFTGSVPVGKQIMRKSADSLKRVTLELGGKNASIVFADAELEPTIDGVAKAVFLNQGQVCGSCSRVYVEESIHDEAVEAIRARVEALRPGYGLDPDVTFGPLISREHRDRVSGYVDSGRGDGATLAVSGTLPEDERLRDGFYARPAVFTGVDDAMAIAREEIFGPVMSVMRFRDADDVVARANALDVGLTGSVWSRDLRKAIAVGRRLRTGTVWINDALQAPSEGIWGGFKSSGIGRELGRWGIEEYLEQRQLYVNLANE